MPYLISINNFLSIYIWIIKNITKVFIIIIHVNTKRTKSKIQMKTFFSEKDHDIREDIPFPTILGVPEELEGLVNVRTRWPTPLVLNPCIRWGNKEGTCRLLRLSVSEHPLCWNSGARCLLQGDGAMFVPVWKIQILNFKISVSNKPYLQV